MILFIIHLIQQNKIKKALEYKAYGPSGQNSAKHNVTQAKKPYKKLK